MSEDGRAAGERRIAVGDIGGTHARFALATLDGDGGAPSVEPPKVYDAADHPDLASAWRRFVADSGCHPADLAGVAIAVAGPADGATIKLTNSAWSFRRDELGASLGVAKAAVLNDFAAMAWGISALAPADFVRVAGPDAPLPGQGVISVIGPGTGLGVAQLIRGGGDGGARVVPCEGGHAAFAPLDAFEDGLLADLRATYGRVSIERLVSGPGLSAFWRAIAGRPDAAPPSDADLWRAALAGDDADARAALERLASAYGAAAGDIALVHGAAGVALAGDLTGRMREQLRAGGFAERFAAKGRHAARMAALPVRWAKHEQVGLLGAAVAFSREHTG